MPKPDEKGKKGDEKAKPPKEEMTPGKILKNFWKCYERNCIIAEASIPVALIKRFKENIQEDTFITCFIFRPNAKQKASDLPIDINPFTDAIRSQRYTQLQEIRVLNIALPYYQMAAMGLLLEKKVYPIKIIELRNCLIEPPGLGRFARSLNACQAITHLALDFNEFGNKGCQKLSNALLDNTTILHLSLNYCKLGPESGEHLGEVIACTAIQTLLLDGNDLQCEGAVNLIKACVEQAEVEAFQKAEEIRLQKEAVEEAERRAIEKKKRRLEGELVSPDPPVLIKEEVKKKKKKEPPGPPPVGPWIKSLHLVDNGIDVYDTNGLLAPMVCMRMFRKLIAGAPFLEDLDIDDNLIGEIGAQEILAGLRERTESKLPSCKMRITHRLEPNVLDEIWKLGAGAKKKGKK